MGITCVLSILGSFLIIISYFLFRELRTNARLVLVHISVADLGVAASNLFGDAVRFERFFNHTSNEFKPAVFGKICKVQAFIAHFSTMSSVLWTIALAVLMYAVVKRLITTNNSKKFMCFFCVFCYGMPLFLSLWMICTDKLGFSPYDTSGWCGTIIYNGFKVDYMTAVFGYDLWMVLTSVFIIVTYLSLHFYVKQEVSSTVKPALVTTCIQRPPVFRDHLVMSQLWLYHAFLPLLRDHLYSKTTFFWPKRGRLIQVSLYQYS